MILLSAVTQGPSASAQDIPVPSGQPLSLNEVLLDEAPGALWVRFRFLAPGIDRANGAIDFEEAGGDMDYLCQNLALPYLDLHELNPARIVVSFSDRPVPFGVTDPDATQFFETYRPENGVCIWEEF